MFFVKCGVTFLMNTILATSKLTVRFQVTIPRMVRKKLNLQDQAGTTIVFVENGKGEIIIKQIDINKIK